MEPSFGPDPTRAMLLIDLDGFYAQVEQVRLGLTAQDPLAVLQWNLLIATNVSAVRPQTLNEPQVAAKKLGIKRGVSPPDAKKICPSLRLVHVETIGRGGTITEGSADQHDRKITLKRYRTMSQRIFKIIRSFVLTSEFEKASIDECFVDVTRLANLRIAHVESGKLPSFGSVDSAWKIVGDSFKPQKKACDLLLHVAAIIAAEIRHAVFVKLGFTMTCGISHTKSLAKLSCPFNKPNGQTIVPLASVQRLLAETPLENIRLLGGKLGRALLELGCTTAASVLEVPPDTLAKAVGTEKMRWLRLYCSGRDKKDALIVPRILCSSMMESKSFRTPLATHADLYNWLQICSLALSERVEEELEDNQRLPTKLTFWCGTKQPGAALSAHHTKQCSFTPQKRSWAEYFVQLADTLHKKLGSPLHIHRLAVGVGEFVCTAPAPGEQSLESIFAKSSAPRTHPPGATQSVSTQMTMKSQATASKKEKKRPAESLDKLWGARPGKKKRRLAATVCPACGASFPNFRILDEHLESCGL